MKPNSTNDGYTMVEIVVSMFLIGVVTVSIWTLFVLAGRANTAAADQTECATLAQQQMERLKHVEFDTLTNGGSIETLLPGYHQKVDVNSDARADYAVSWAVAFATAPSTAKPLAAKDVSMRSLKVRCESLRAAGTAGAPKQVVFHSFRTKGIQ